VIFERVGMFRFQLSDMEDRVYADRGREAEGERHRRGLQDDEKGADLLLHKLAGGPICTNMVSMHINVIANMEGRGFHAVLVRVVGH